MPVCDYLQLNIYQIQEYTVSDEKGADCELRPKRQSLEQCDGYLYRVLG